MKSRQQDEVINKLQKIENLLEKKKLSTHNTVKATPQLYISKPHHCKYLDHRKIPSSKYSGRYISDTVGFTEALSTDEEIEPP